MSVILISKLNARPLDNIDESEFVLPDPGARGGGFGFILLIDSSLFQDVKSDVAHQLTLCRQLEQSLPADESPNNIDRLQLRNLVTEIDVSVAYLEHDARVLKHDALTASNGIAGDIGQLSQFWNQVRPLVAGARTEGFQVSQLKEISGRIAASLSRIEIARKLCLAFIAIFSVFLLIAGQRLVRIGSAGPMTELQKDIGSLRQAVECAEQHSDDLAAVVPAGVLVVGQDLTVLSVNRVCREMLDLGPGEFRVRASMRFSPALNYAKRPSKHC